MRISYTDEEDFPGQSALWQSNVNRCLLGKRGQAALRKLRDALLALTEKRLAAKVIATTDGEVCAIGAVLMHQTPPAEREARLKQLAELDECEDATEYAPKDFPSLAAWAIVAENDIGLEHAPPELRYVKMLQWVEARLAGKKLPI